MVSVEPGRRYPALIAAFPLEKATSLFRRFPLTAATVAKDTMKEDGGKTEPNHIALDRTKFKQQLCLRAVRIPKQHSHFVSKTLSRFTLERPKLKHVIHDPECADNRLVLLNEQINDVELFEAKLAELRSTFPVEVVPHELELDYKYYSVEQVLKEILPDGLKAPASFETVGHIAHLNLTDELLPFRKLIAQVFLDKNQPKITTIVNKVGTISNEFRVPAWEVLAGDTDLVTEVKQHNATFRLDFGAVYWNSRLEFEHKRLCSQFQPGQVILDMFAGIGPFAIPAAQKGCVVFANDLNPASVQYLEVNAKINKVTGNISAYNLDAREFVRHFQQPEEVRSMTPEKVGDEGRNGSSIVEPDLVQVKSDSSRPNPSGAEFTGEEAPNFADVVMERHTEKLSPDKFVSFSPSDDKTKLPMLLGKSKRGKGPRPVTIAKSDAKPWEVFHHVVMNLPASALEFLDVFNGLLSREMWKGSMPRVHCYCFMRASETLSDLVERAESILGSNIQRPDVWTVRDVAPNKIMLCISFDLPEAVAFREDRLLDKMETGSRNKSGGDLDFAHSAEFPHIQSKRSRTES